MSNIALIKNYTRFILESSFFIVEKFIIHLYCFLHDALQCKFFLDDLSSTLSHFYTLLSVFNYFIKGLS